MHEQGRRRVPGVDRVVRNPPQQMHAFLQAGLAHLPAQDTAPRTVADHHQVPGRQRRDTRKPRQRLDENVEALVCLETADRDQQAVPVAGADEPTQAAHFLDRPGNEAVEIDRVGNDRR